MSVKVQVKKKLIVPSVRVKCVDLHPEKPWVLSGLYDGKATIMNYKTGEAVKSLDVSVAPIRCAKFIARERWIICGGDEMRLIVFSYNTSKKEISFEAHGDYIRSIAVNESRPYVISCADDLSIKMWDWSAKWNLVRQFDGHSHYIMHLTFNPKDHSMFSSASLDGTVRMWNVSSSTPSFTLEGHPKGVNGVGFYYGKERPFVVSGCDDRLVRVWDFQTKACVQTLQGHSENVTETCFHPRLGVIISGSEDHAVCIWNDSTYALVERLTYGLGRIWSIVPSRHSTAVAIGFDNGTLVLSLGKEIPVVSMDRRGKICLARKNEITQLSVRRREMAEVLDGERIVSLTSKDLGITDLTPTFLQHDPKGRNVAVCGDGEFVVYKAVSWRSQCYGKAEEFAWSVNAGQFAVKLRSGKIKVYVGFQDSHELEPSFYVERIYGGELLSLVAKDCVYFYDWETLTMIRVVEIEPNSVLWSDNGETVVLATDDKMFFLNFNASLVKTALEEETVDGDDGVVDALELDFEIPEKLKQGMWIGDCFIYISADKTLKYYIAASITDVALLDKTYYLLGFVSNFNRIFLMDKENNVVTYQLHVVVLQYQAAIVSGDFDAAEGVFPRIPQECYGSLAHFLEKNAGGDDRLLEKALEISADVEQRFKLSLQLGRLDQCVEIARKSHRAEEKWRQIGSACLEKCDFELAETCLLHGKDYPGLLLLYSSFSNMDGLAKLGELARASGRNNIAFTAFMLAGRLHDCADLLQATERFPEAAFFTRTYMPSQMSDVTQKWKRNLAESNERAARALADPSEYPNMFPSLEEALALEKVRDAPPSEAPGVVQEEEEEEGEKEAPTVLTVSEESLAADQPDEVVPEDGGGEVGPEDTGREVEPDEETGGEVAPKDTGDEEDGGLSPMDQAKKMD